MESSSECDTDIPIVPWLRLIFIYFDSFLITLSPTIEMCMILEPIKVSKICRITEEFFFTTSIEEIYSKSELMLAISRRSTERVCASPKIPESLLVGGTPISADHSEWHIEL